MNIPAILKVAMEAATDSEWGYTSSDALEYLREIDPSREWEEELLQAELETGRRFMGPQPPPSGEVSALMALYLPIVTAHLESSPLLTYLKKGHARAAGRDHFTIPLEVGRNENPF